MADVEIEVGANVSELQKGFDKVVDATKEVKNEVEDLGKRSGNTWKDFATGLNQAIELASKFANALKAPLEAFREQEVAANKLTAALENQGLNADALSIKYKAIAASLQEKTGVDDDAIVSNLALLQSFTGQQEISDDLALTLVNLAERTGSMESAATKLGQAIQGNAGGLKKFTGELDLTGTKAERTQQIIDKLSVSVGGAAEAANQGLGGVRGLQSAFGDLLETVGEELAPVISSIIVELKKMTKELTNNAELKSAMKVLADGIKIVFDVTVLLVKKFIEFGQLLGKTAAQVQGFFGKIGNFFSGQKNFTFDEEAFKAGGGTIGEAPKAAGGGKKPDRVKEVTEEEQAILDAKKAAADKVAAEQERRDQEIIDNRTQLNDRILEQSAEFQALDDEQKAVFLKENQDALAKSFLTVEEAQTAAINDQLKRQIDANNRFLKEQQKYGTAYAAINSVIYSDQIQGAAKASGELAQLQKSGNATLKSIGKAAALTDISIKTSQSAIAAYQGTLAFFSFLGPFANIPAIAAAAAATAFGAEQAANVVSAARGGVVPGANFGGDSVPALLQPGELISPRNNFNEVVNAVADKRAGESAEASSGVSTGGGGGSTDITTRLEFNGDGAEKFLTARQVEATKLGTRRQARS